MPNEMYTLYLVSDISESSITTHGIQNDDFVLRVRVESPYKPFFQIKKGELVHLGHLEDYLLGQAADTGAASFKAKLSPKATQHKTTLNSLNISREELTQLMEACRTPSPTKQALLPTSPQPPVSGCASPIRFFNASITVPPINPFPQYNEDESEGDFNFEELFSTTPPPG